MSQLQAPFPAQIRAAFEWWQEAGVDLEYADDATDWLAQEASPEPTGPKEVSSKAPAPAEVTIVEKKIDLLGDNPPQDLAAFREWWLSEPALDQVGIRGRIAPTGPANPDFMVLVVTPEESDRQSLLSGPQGELFNGFLRAAGLKRSEIYLASVLPRHMPIVDGTALTSAGYDKVLMHHISLVSPKRLLAFGRNISPLLGHDAAHETTNLENVNHDGRKLPLMVAQGLDSMMAMPRLKARFWRKWLDWTEG